MAGNSKRRAALNRFLADPHLTPIDRLIYRRRLAALDQPKNKNVIFSTLWTFICWAGAGIMAALLYEGLVGDSHSPHNYNDADGLDMQGGMDLGYYQRRGYPMGIQGYGESITDVINKAVDNRLSKRS